MTGAGEGVPSPLRVVVADDEPDVRLMLRVALPEFDVDVVGEAGDGHEALEVCQLTKPHAIVLDLLMPGLNGFQAIPQLRDRCPQTGIVAYTAVAGEFVRSEMSRQQIPLVLKQGTVEPLVTALRDAAQAVEKGNSDSA